MPHKPGEPTLQVPVSSILKAITPMLVGESNPKACPCTYHTLTPCQCCSCRINSKTLVPEYSHSKMFCLHLAPSRFHKAQVTSAMAQQHSVDRLPVPVSPSHYTAKSSDEGSLGFAYHQGTVRLVLMIRFRPQSRY